MNTATAQRRPIFTAGDNAKLSPSTRLESFKSGLGQPIEETKSMGKSEQRALESRLEILLMQILKRVFQADDRGISWEISIEKQRRRIVDHMAKNPRLKSKSPTPYRTTYDDAVVDAAKQTRLSRSIFPVFSPWTFEHIIDDAFWPETASPLPS